MSSSGSALFGEPPANDRDRLILIGLGRSRTNQYKVPKPVPLAPGSPESQAKGFVIGTVFAIVLITLITGTRLAARTLFRRQKFGADDIVVIPAVVSRMPKGWQ